ncbi:MAG: RNA polymerase sigma factor [Polyangiaceae bacterium]
MTAESPTERPMSVEHELIQRALAGDGRAFATLVEPHLPMLYRVAMRACGNPSLAEDAVQEALTIAYQKLNRYEPGTSLKSFLAACAMRRAQTLLRGERRRQKREEAADAPEKLAGPASVSGAKQTAERIRTVLERLPEKRRAAALLRLDAGLSYAEIAEALGTTEGSARVLVHMVVKELREALADLVDPSEIGAAP